MSPFISLAHIAKSDEIFDDYVLFVIRYSLIILNTELFKDILFFGWQTVKGRGQAILNAVRLVHIKILIDDQILQHPGHDAFGQIAG